MWKAVRGTGFNSPFLFGDTVLLVKSCSSFFPTPNAFPVLQIFLFCMRYSRDAWESCGVLRPHWKLQRDGVEDGEGSPRGGGGFSALLSP